MNSPALWYLAFRTLPHKKDEALAMDIPYVRTFPIPPPDDRAKDICRLAVQRLADISDNRHRSVKAMTAWLRVEFEVGKPSQKLQSPALLSADEFTAEVKKVRGRKAHRMTSAAVQALRDEYAATIEPLRMEAAEAVRLERQLSELVNAAYGLTPDEVRLMWQTAPPRMPVAAAPSLAS